MDNNNQSTKLTTDDLTAKTAAFKPVQNLNSNTETGETPMKNEAQKMEMTRDYSNNLLIAPKLSMCLIKFSLIEKYFELMVNDPSNNNSFFPLGYRIICHEVSSMLKKIYDDLPE